MSPAHTYRIVVPPTAIDANGHANNVEFVRWMQEAAVSHAGAVGCTAATLAAGATWLVRSHQVEYLRPAYAGDEVEVRTWVADVRRAFSTREYEFVRRDGAGETVLARGQTDWVFVDASTGRPRSVPPEVIAGFGMGGGGMTNA